MIPVIRRWDDVGALTLDGTAGSFRVLVKATLLAAGWTVEWEDVGAQKLVMRNDQTAGGNDAWIRILDDGSGAGGAREAFLQCYEHMTDIDTGTGPATALNSGNGVVICKSMALSGASRPYVIGADALRLYGGIYANSETVPTPIDNNTSGNHLTAFAAGAPAMSIPGDPSVMVAGRDIVNINNWARSPLVRASGVGDNWASTVQGFSLSRDASLSASVTPCSITRIYPGNQNNPSHGNANFYPTAPLPGYAGTMCIPSILVAGGTIRGQLPGLYAPTDGVSLTVHLGDTVTPILVASPREMLVISGYGEATNNSASGAGRLYIDTGDWDA